MGISNIVPWKRSSGVSPFTTLQREMNRLFDDFFTDTDIVPFSALEKQMGKFSPKIDVIENNESVVVTAELPGLEEKDVDITLNKDLLMIRGEKKEEYEKKEDKNRYYLERTYGSFERAIPLNVAIDEDKVEATFKKGVLKITLPKTAEEKKQTKKISVKT